MICEVTTRCVFTIEHQSLDDAEELIADLIVALGDHPQMLSDPDPLVRAHRGNG